METSGHNGRLYASTPPLVYLCLHLTSLLVSVGGKEYCQFDWLNATCPAGQVVLMTNARYGRFRVGDCVLKDYGNLGCGTSVLEPLDSECSGKPTCNYHVPKLRARVQPCPEDLTSYLEASHECIPVVHPASGAKCNSSISLNATTSRVHVANYVALHHGLASPQCPVHVRALPGQTLNISMYSFQHDFDLDHTSDSLMRSCPFYAVITEGNKVIRHDLCKLRSRLQHLNLTDGNHLEFYFHTRKFGRQDPANFIARIDAIGCPDLNPLAGAHVERKGDGAVVYCNNSQETWYLTCKGTTWIGTLTNCSAPTAPSNNEHVDTKSPHLPFGLLVAITIGVVLGILFGIVMLIAVFVIRRRRRERTPPKVNTLLGEERDGSQHDSEDIYCRRIWHDCPHHAATLPGTTTSGMSSVYSRTPSYNTHPAPQHICSGDYTQMLELQSHATSSPQKAAEPLYGRHCQRHVKFLDSASLNLSQAGASVDNGSMATFKPQESNYGTTPGSRRTQMPVCCSNVDHELYSVDEHVAETLPPEKQPDVVQQGGNSSSGSGPESGGDSLRNLQNWLHEQSHMKPQLEMLSLSNEAADNKETSEQVAC